MTTNTNTANTITTGSDARDKETNEGLAIIELYASALADSAKKDGRIKEDALLDVLEVINASDLTEKERRSAVRVAVAVLRCALTAWEVALERVRRKNKRTWNRRANSAVLVASDVLMASAVYFQWESVAYLALACFVGVACPALASWMRAIADARLSQTRKKNDVKKS